MLSVSSQPSHHCVYLCHVLLCYLFQPNPVILVFTCVMFYYVICFIPTQSSLCLPVSCFTMLSVSSQPSQPCVNLCHVLLCYLFHPNPVSHTSNANGRQSHKNTDWQSRPMLPVFQPIPVNSRTIIQKCLGQYSWLSNKQIKHVRDITIANIFSKFNKRLDLEGRQPVATPAVRRSFYNMTWFF